MIYLASQSPRRVELLQQIGVSFQQCLGEIDETPIAEEQPETYVQRMAKEKALAAWSAFISLIRKIHHYSADTTVVSRQHLGKPGDACMPKHATAAFGQTHQVMSSLLYMMAINYDNVSGH